MATVVLLGTLDTKGVEYEYLRKRVQAAGCEVILVDAGIKGTPLTRPDVTREEVAKAVGADVAQLAAGGDRGAAVETMARGATASVLDLFNQGRLHGILGLGGSGGSALVTQAMRALPIGVPKLMVSTLASGDTRPYVGAVDVSMMYSVVDIAGINRISERILTNAAAAIAGMGRAYAGFQPSPGVKPLVGATMFGVTTPSVTEARKYLEERGYEVLVFHATGTGGRSIEALKLRVITASPRLSRWAHWIWSISAQWIPCQRNSRTVSSISTILPSRSCALRQKNALNLAVSSPAS